METGTLKELNVQPGDVVEYAGYCKRRATIAGWRNGRCYSTDQEIGSAVSLDSTGAWRIVSRATPPVDLTAITTPFGLLDPATQEALRAHGGPYEVLCGDGWCIVNKPRWLSWIAYRIKPAPIRETVKRSLHGDNFMGYVAIDLVDGSPDWGSLRKWGDE